jgi:hypothetical protein
MSRIEDEHWAHMMAGCILIQGKVHDGVCRYTVGVMVFSQFGRVKWDSKSVAGSRSHVLIDEVQPK